jgi:quercetin dioxygenase-like cupin family protein
MKVFDINALEAFPYEKREKNVLFEDSGCKVRIIELKAGQKMPECKMDCQVIFYVVNGEIEVTKDSSSLLMGKNQMLITEPALLSMETKTGAKILGIQIKKEA